MNHIGIDLGGTNIVASVVNDAFEILGTGKLKTNCPRPAEDIFDDMAKATFMAVEDAGLTMDEIESVGFGTPGAVDFTNGIIKFSSNLQFHEVPAVKMLESRLEKRVFIGNDANCAAYGEMLAGAGKGVKDMVAVTLGTGVGSGIIVNNKIVTGYNDAAGEIGHTVIRVDGYPCPCGRKGCWESYASATALIRQTKEAIERTGSPIMRRLVAENGKVSGKTAFEAMRMGDDTAKQVVETYAKYVACGLVNIINTFQPEVLCIGGGVSHEGAPLLDPMMKYIEAETYTRGAAKQTKLKLAELGNKAGIIGAAFLFQNE